MFSNKNRFISIMVAIALAVGSFESVGATGKIYYVSTTGSDYSAGTASAPFLTFKKAISMMTAGDELQIYGGTYAQDLTVSISGTSSAYISIKPVSSQSVIIDGGIARTRGVFLSGSYIVLDGLEVQRALDFCVDVTGSYVTVRNVNVHDCNSSGLRVKGKNDLVENSAFYNNSLKNAWGTGSSWGIALRVMLGGENVTLRNNKVYNNWGEGLGVLQAKYVNVLNNTVYDNFSQNVYIDNSMDVKIENNFVYSINPTFFKSGLPANCISMAEEYYDGWGAQLARIRIVNNIAAFCRRGIGYTYAEVTNGGLDTVTIANNTIWNTADTAIVVINQTYKTRNSVIANNIVQQTSGKLADIQPTSGISAHNNFWVSPINLLNNASGTSDRTGDVRMASTPTTDPTSFRLSSSSPAIGGAADLGITKDFEGNTRGLPYDMGAIEYAGTISPTPTPTQVPAQGSTTYDDKNAILSYAGSWTDVADGGAYGGSFRKSTMPGSSVTMTFTGTSFSLLYTKNSTFTKMDVFLDGTLVGTIDQYASSRQLQQKWNSPKFTSGTHALKLVHKGTDTTTRVSLDAVTIYP